MYFCCGSIVIFASIWLFIGNFINYRLLEREKKQAQRYKPTETEDPDQGAEQKASEETAEKAQSDEQSMQRETNI